MAEPKYAGMDKDALSAEIKNRRAAGRKINVDLRADPEKLRAALETDDMENGDFDPNAPTSGSADEKPNAAATDATGSNPPNGPPAESRTPLPPVAARNADIPAALRNQISKQPEIAGKPTQPSDDEFSKGTLARHKGDGMLYQVVKDKPDEFNKSVKARVPAQDSGHPGMYWEGSEAEFVELFEKA